MEEFCRFPFAFPINDTTAKNIIRCLLHLFDIFAIQDLSTQIVEDNYSRRSSMFFS